DRGRGLAWSRTHGSPDAAYDAARGVGVDDQGRPIVWGVLQTQPLLASTAFDRDAWIAGHDARGERLWSRTLDGPARLIDEANAVVAADQALLIGGATSPGLEGLNAWIAALPAPNGGEREVQIERPDPPAAPVHHGGDGCVVADAESMGDAPAQRHRATLYLAFEGGDLRPGDRGPLGEVSCLEGHVRYPAYSGTAQDVEAVGAIVKAALAPYGVRVVWGERPPVHLPYTTV